MGNLIYQQEIYDDSVIELELKDQVPIVGVICKPIVNFQIDAPCQFKWIKFKDKEKVLVGQSLSYTPLDNDSTYQLEFTCILYCNHEDDGIKKTIITNPVVGFPELNITRKIINIPRETINIGKIDYLGTTLFRITCYNLLSQSRIKPEMYSDCPSYVLGWVYRKKVLFSEIRLLDSDIFCLQELPSKEIWEYWDIELSKIGFSSFLPDKNSKFGKLDYTNGIFFRRIKFSLMKQWIIDYDQILNELYPDKNVQSNEYAIIVLLEFKDTIKDSPNKILVINTHISSNFNSLQVPLLLNSIQDLVKKESKDFILPVLLAGSFDFDEKSDLYQKITVENNFKSIMKVGIGKEPLYSLSKSVQVNVKDFLFYTDNIFLSQVMDFDDQIYPNVNSCSDHVPLYAEFDVKK